ncbi:HAD-IIIA family hydrolase [bacterium]|nr:HAD-IIIA family hydrolase [bacterium]
MSKELDLKPDIYCKDVTQVPFAELHSRGIDNICIDVDNTLALRDSYTVNSKILTTLEEARKCGYIKNICVVSNIIFGAKRAKRVEEIAKQLNTPHFFAARFWHRKPGPKPFLEAMKMMDSQPQNTAIIGDQIFTDILGGKRLGLFTVLVKPLGPDHWCTALTNRRKREEYILREMRLHHHKKEQ